MVRGPRGAPVGQQASAFGLFQQGAGITGEAAAAGDAVGDPGGGEIERQGGILQALQGGFSGG